MLRFRLIPVVLGAATLVALVAPARSARADPAAEARFFDAQARAHYAAGRYREALRAFFEEQRLAPNPRIVFNIALCFERLGRERQAYAFYGEYLASDETSGERRAYARKAKARLERRVSRIEVVTEPPGAEIFVDEPEHGTYGESPREVVVSPGRHVVFARRPGYREQEVEVRVGRGRLARAQLTLVPIRGTVQVECTPPAEVQVRDPDGRTVVEGPTPFETPLPVGVYVVALSAPGHKPSEAVIKVEADRVVTHRATLDELPPPSGEVVFTANVPGALVEVDGAPVGFAPVVSRLPAGAHALRITHPDRRPYGSDLTVRPDQRAWLTAQLEPPARTERSPLTWVSGGLGLALLGAGAVVGLVANERQDDFEAARRAGDPDLLELRSEGEALNVAADTMMVTGAAGLVAAVVLFFVTEQAIETPSSATLSWEQE